MPESPIRRVEPVVARAEAQPLLWSKPDDPTRELSDEQKGAAEQACAVMRQLAERPWQPRRERNVVPNVDHFLPTIDPERLNHVVLLDGKRGSGKTALLITLLHGWSWGVRGRPKRERFDPDQELEKRLAPLGRIVPVGLVDLQPLPKSTNLILHLVGQLHRVVEAMEEQVAPASRAAWHPVGAEELPSRRSWRYFLQAAAAGWDGNLERRSGHLDPEAYAQELEEASRRRLDVVSTFRGFLDDLTEDYRRFVKLPEHEPPFFVIPVDDADMNPRRSVELLDLVRTLWHPRMAFLLTGDTQLFIDALFPRMLGDLVQGAGTHFSDPKSVEHRAQELARDIYNKAIPAGHRCSLATLAPYDRYSRLKHDLAQAAIMSPAPNAPASLADLLERSIELCEALPDRLRAIADLKQQATLGRKTADDLLAPLWADAMQSPDLTLDQRALLWDSTRNLQGAQLTKALNQQIALDFDARTTERVPNSAGFSLIVFTDLYPRGKCAGNELPTRHTACAILAAELYKWRAYSILNYSKLSENKGVIFTEHDLSSRVPWQLPQWLFAEDYLRFFRSWKEETQELLRTGVTSIDVWAMRFIASVLRHAGADLPSSNQAADPAELAAATVRLAESRDEANRLWALTRAPLLAAPEFGLSPKLANAWLKVMVSRLHEFNQEIDETIFFGARRELAITWLSAKSMERMLEDLDRAFPEHLWGRLVEKRPQQPLTNTKPADATQALNKHLDEVLSRIHVRFPFSVSPHSGATSKRADQYITTSRRADISTLPAQTITAMIDAITPILSQQNPAQESVAELWKAACHIDKDLPSRELILFNNGQAVINSSAFAWTGSPAIEQEEPYLDIAIDARKHPTSMFRMCRANLSWRVGDSADPLIGSAHRALLRLAWDVVCDEEQRLPTGENPFAPWWVAAGFLRSQAKLGAFPWPAVRWPSFLDWEHLIEAWNGRYSQLGEIASNQRRGPRMLQHADVDALAYWYVETLLAISQNHGPAPDRVLSRKQREQDWMVLLAQITARRTDHSKYGLSWRSFVCDCNRLALLAAPESGLGRDTAEWILRGFGAEPETAASLRNFRRERLRFLGMNDNDQIEAELQAIDAMFQDHPWSEQIEQHRWALQGNQ